MLKLLDCNNFWSPSGGGVRRYHLEKLAFFKNRQDVHYVFVMHDVRTYTEQIGDLAFIEHIKVPKVLGNWEYRYLIQPGPLESVLLKHQPDVIEVGSPYIMPRLVKRIIQRNHLKCKVFGFWHADFPVTYVRRFVEGILPKSADWAEKIAWKYARKNFNWMDGVMVASEEIQHRMVANGMERTVFVPLGVHSDFFYPKRRDVDLANRLKAGASDRLILFFPHRFSREKGLHILLQAYEILSKQMELPPALVIAGTGPLEKLVHSAASRFEHVHFEGFIRSKEDMARYYASADLGFALSSWETFGLSLLECLSSGVPLIAAGKGAAGEHIRKSGAGLVLEALTPQALSDAILKLAATDLNQMRTKARAYAEQFSWEQCFHRQLQVYQSPSVLKES